MLGNEIVCKHCGNDGLLKYGKYKGTQLYWCKVCKRKIKADDTTFHMKTPTNQVTSAVNSYYEGMSIKAIRRHLLQEHDNAPSTATIYEWIQKYTRGYLQFFYSNWAAKALNLSIISGLKVFS